MLYDRDYIGRYLAWFELQPKQGYVITIEIRHSKEYNDWRKSVYKRDNYTCQECGYQPRQRLEVHHIKPFNEIIYENKIETMEQARLCKQLWDISNGITLCKQCHVPKRAKKDV